ncbi:MAG: GGDEF domain-containing protein [Oscillochloris sp.]|nr:GGDEF domain-containing protein [Oscillochloris sp.]
MRRLLGALEHLSPRGHVIICLICLTAIMMADLSTATELTFTMLYLIPITLGAWYVSERFGQALMLSSTVAWLSDGLLYRTELGALLWNTGLWSIFTLLIVVLVVNLHDSYRREHALARRDPLTSAFNRRAFLDLLEYELARLRRLSQPLTLAYIDLDNFKAINDLLGHSVGDELLIHATALMHKNLRSIDRVARLGGDEFVILMPATDAPAAEIALVRLQKTIQADMLARHWPVTLSVGAVAFYQSPETIDLAISLADRTMYRVKQGGKDCVHVISWGG